MEDDDLPDAPWLTETDDTLPEAPWLSEEGRSPPPSAAYKATPATPSDPNANMGAWESAGEGAAHFAIPGVASIVAGMKAGAATPGPPIAKLGVGALVGLGGGYLVEAAQEKLFDLLGISEGEGFLSNKRKQAAQEQHPYAYQAGGLGSSIVALSPTKTAASGAQLATTIAERMLSGGVLGGVEAGIEAYSTGQVDPKSVAISTAFGAAFPHVRPWAGGAVGTGARAGKPAHGEAIPEEPLAPGATPEDVIVPESPAARAAREADLEAEGTRIINEGAIEAPVTPPGPGVAAEHAPAPEVAGVGNDTTVIPRGSRDGAKKVALLPEEGAESTSVSRKPISDDIAAAIAEENPVPVREGPAAPMEVGIAPPAPSNWQVANNAEAVRVAEAMGLTPKIEAMAREGRTAKEISLALGERLDANDVRAVRDSLGIDPAGPLMTPGGATIGLEARRAPKGVSLLPEEPPLTDTALANRLRASPAEAAIEAARAPAVDEGPVLARMRVLGLNQVAERIEALPPGAKRAEAVAIANEAYPRIPSARKTAGEEGVQTGGGERDVRKRGVLDAVKETYDNFAAKEIVDPLSLMDTVTVHNKPNRDALLQRLQKALTFAKAKNNGVSPTDRKLGYWPRVKPKEWQWVRAAEETTRKPTPANLVKFLETEQLLRGGGAKDLQQTKRINADIELGRRPTVEQGELGARVGAERAREDFPLLPKWKKGADESKHFIDANNRMRTWINSLSDEDYHRLESKYPDGLRQEVESTSNPQWVLNQLKKDLKAPEPVRNGIPQVRGAVPKQVSAAPETAESFTPAKAASPGRVLTGAEKETAAAQALAKLNASMVKEGTVGYKPENKFSAFNREAERPPSGETAQPPTPPDQAMTGNIIGRRGDGTGRPIREPLHPAATDAVIDFIQSKEPPGRFKRLKDFFRQGISDETYSARKPRSLLDSAALEVSERLNTLNKSLADTDVKVLKTGKEIPAEYQDPKMGRKHYRALEQGKIDTLSPKEQNFVRRVYEPMQKQFSEIYRAIRLFDPDLPPEQPNHMGRILKGESAYDHPRIKHGEMSANPIEGIDPTSHHGGERALSTSAGPIMPRTYFVLKNETTGTRTVVALGDDGKLTQWIKGKSKILKTPTSFEPEVGNSFKVGGNTLTMSPAYAQEITANARNKGKPIEYHENAYAVLADNIKKATGVLRHMQFLDSFKTDPRFVYDPKTGLGGATTNKKLADKLGWKESLMPQFRGWHMAPAFQHVFDDFVRPGFHGGPNWDKLRYFNQQVIRLLFWLPTAHLNNVFGHQIVGLGWQLINPKTYALIPKAIQSVYRHEPKYSEVLGVIEGKNPTFYDPTARAAGMIYPGVISQDFYRSAAKMSGLEMVNNKAKWDPIARTLGIPFKDLVWSVFRASQKVMWAGNDMMLMHMVMVNEAKGWPLAKSIREAERHFPNYRVPAEIMGSRMLSQLVQEFTFGRYHYGMINAHATIVKKLVNGPGAERTEAIGNLMAIGILGYVYYPAMIKAAQYITGNEEASVHPRGPISLPIHVGRAIGMSPGHREDISTAVGGVVTIPPVLSTGLEQLRNKDWRGKSIREPGDMSQIGAPESTIGERLRALGKVGVQTGEHLARGLVSPYNTVATSMNKDQSGWASVRDLALDIKNPTEAATKYANKQERLEAAAVRARDKKGYGPLEALYNRLTQ